MIRRLVLFVLLLIVACAAYGDTCAALDSGRKYIDTDCDGVRDTGELYVDDAMTEKAMHVVIADPDATAANYVFRLPAWAGTMTQIDCECYGGTNLVIDVCDGEDYSDDTCTTSIPGANMTCTTSGATDSSLSATGFAARDKISLVLVSESGTCDRLEVYITGTRD